MQPGFFVYIHLVVLSDSAESNCELSYYNRCFVPQHNNWFLYGIRFSNLSQKPSLGKLATISIGSFFTG